jgi:hypothetical protein
MSTESKSAELLNLKRTAMAELIEFVLNNETGREICYLLCKGQSPENFGFLGAKVF